ADVEHAFASRPRDAIEQTIALAHLAEPARIDHPRGHRGESRTPPDAGLSEREDESRATDREVERAGPPAHRRRAAEQPARQSNQAQMANDAGCILAVVGAWHGSLRGHILFLSTR